MTQIHPRYDIVIDATDNVPSRYMINDCCVVLGKVIIIIIIIFLWPCFGDKYLILICVGLNFMPNRRKNFCYTLLCLLKNC